MVFFIFVKIYKMAIPQAILLMVVSLWGVALGISAVLVAYAVLSDVVCSSRSDVVSDRSCRATMKTKEIYKVFQKAVCLEQSRHNSVFALAGVVQCDDDLSRSRSAIDRFNFYGFSN